MSFVQPVQPWRKDAGQLGQQLRQSSLARKTETKKGSDRGFREGRCSDGGGGADSSASCCGTFRGSPPVPELSAAIGWHRLDERLLDHGGCGGGIGGGIGVTAGGSASTASCWGAPLQVDHTSSVAVCLLRYLRSCRRAPRCRRNRCGIVDQRRSTRPSVVERAMGCANSFKQIHHTPRFDDVAKIKVGDTRDVAAPNLDIALTEVLQERRKFDARVEDRRKLDSRPEDTVSVCSSVSLRSRLTTMTIPISSRYHTRRTDDDMLSDAPTITESVADMEELEDLFGSNTAFSTCSSCPPSVFSPSLAPGEDSEGEMLAVVPSDLMCAVTVSRNGTSGASFGGVAASAASAPQAPRRHCGAAYHQQASAPSIASSGAGEMHHRGMAAKTSRSEDHIQTVVDRTPSFENDCRDPPAPGSPRLAEAGAGDLGRISEVSSDCSFRAILLSLPDSTFSSQGSKMQHGVAGSRERLVDLFEHLPNPSNALGEQEPGAIVSDCLSLPLPRRAVS
eukprot:TRINITY_DN55518_c0_g1_i1.p1 TRINITY_DN55518_c0_g1~~TRINITY_DN55518_c0_g1_i1.p1  ORF type:complete len:506 (-),score=70.61 TRINITY_DN55518_c0_g1_i1:47-1564(-)